MLIPASTSQDGYIQIEDGKDGAGVGVGKRFGSWLALVRGVEKVFLICNSV